MAVNILTFYKKKKKHSFRFVAVWKHSAAITNLKEALF